MFTGLVEEIGKLRRVGRQGEAMVMTFEASKIISDVNIGDSISVNGVCLTVTAFDRTTFTVDVMPQTYRHSNLKEMKSGHTVNLERAMLAGGRFGGHIVQGHADGTGMIVSRTIDANAVVFMIKPIEANLLRYVVPKGSITVDGISLTVAAADMESFAVSIIPHTLQETALQNKKPGDSINIECDILGKYVDHFMRFGSGQSVPGNTAATAGGANGSGGLSAAFLAEHGFI
jgi:riboflavin synthase